jgi:tubulin polyglutamylase TTLL5
MEKIWKDIYDVIIKSLVAGEKHIVNALRRSVPHRSNCFELFGYDVMLDENLKPWLMEINLSPSLTCDTNLDFIIKSTVLVNLFNMIGFQRFDRKKESSKIKQNSVKESSANDSLSSKFQHSSTLKSTFTVIGSSGVLG